jgi:hypothetical protein
MTNDQISMTNGLGKFIGHWSLVIGHCFFCASSAPSVPLWLIKKK